MTQGNLPLYVAVTADVDPDANRACPGRVDAVSPASGGKDACLEACGEGLKALVPVLERLGIPCTFFWEARSLQTLRRAEAGTLDRILGQPAFEHGCHGLRHEDFSGRESGVRVGAAETLAILDEATRLVASQTSVRPVGFRAPYCRLTPGVRRALRKLGYAYDASVTRVPGQGWTLRPYELPGGMSGRVVWELALCRGLDRSGRPITSYLWQLFEGRRQPEEYVEFASSLTRQYAGGLLQIALHPWHLVVGEDGEPLRGRTGRDPVGDLSDVLSAVASLGTTRFVNAGQYLRLATEGGL